MAGMSKEERSELLRAIKTADANFKKGMYALAEPTYRRGVEVLGDGTPEITGCLQNLAHICAERKDYSEALKLDIQLLLLSEERFGEDHAKTIALMDEIAGLYEKLGRTDESRDMYERARKASERSLWADQSNEPDGVPNPAEIAEKLDLGYQYSDTAKTALEVDNPQVGEIDYEFSTAEPKKKDLSEETMKLPKLTDEQLSAPKKDPQLETLILNKADLAKSQAANGTGIAGSGVAKSGSAGPGTAGSGIAGSGIAGSGIAGSGIAGSGIAGSGIAGSGIAGSDITGSGTAGSGAAGPGLAGPGTAGSGIAGRGITDGEKLSDNGNTKDDADAAKTAAAAILKKMKSKLGESVTTTVIDPNAPITESPEVIGVDAIKPSEWKSDSVMSKIVLGKSLKPDNDKKSSESDLIQNELEEKTPELVVKPNEQKTEIARTSDTTKKEAAKIKQKPVEVKLFQSDRQRNWILGIFLGCFLLLLLTSLFTSHANTQEDFRSMAHRYRTVDGEKLFFLTSQSECEFVAGADTAKMPYYQHHGDVLDTSRIVFGPLIHHPHWLTKQKNAIIDEQGSPLYAEASPELAVSEFAEEIGKAAELTYLKTKHYPKTLNDIESSKRAYHNPFTGQLDKVNVQTVALGKKTQTDDGGQKRKWYDTTISGSRWPNEVKRHAGGINCYSVVVHTKKGDINSFYIRPFDRDGKPFIASQPDTVYAIVLENGTEKPSPKPHLPFKTNGIRPHRAWLMPAMNSSVLFLLKHGAVIVLLIVSFALWILSEATRERNVLSTSLRGAMVVCLIIVLVYTLTGVLP
ncbi:MAG TPA: tetratricopeptide repeat protein [Drouetiella sp.]